MKFRCTFYVEFADGTCRFFNCINPVWDTKMTKAAEQLGKYNVTRVWRQGPKGAVKMVISHKIEDPYGYISSNKELMGEFTWVKLRATELISYA